MVSAPNKPRNPPSAQVGVLLQSLHDAGAKGIAGVDHQCVAGGFGGGGHGEDTGGNVFGGADGVEDVAGGSVLFCFFVVFAKALLEPFSLNEAGSDGIDTDGRAEGACEGFGHNNERRFAGAVGDGAAGADNTGNAGDVDDDATIAGGQGFARGAGHLERALEVNSEDAIPVFIGNGIEIRKINKARGAGVVDENVQLTECVHCFLDHRAAGGILSHIALDDYGFYAGFAALVGDRLGAVGGLVVVDGHAAAGLGELESGGGTDAAGCAGNEG